MAKPLVLFGNSGQLSESENAMGSRTWVRLVTQQYYKSSKDIPDTSGGVAHRLGREVGPDALRRALDHAQHGAGPLDQFLLRVRLRLLPQLLLQVVVEVLARVMVGGV